MPSRKLNLEVVSQAGAMNLSCYKLLNPFRIFKEKNYVLTSKTRFDYSPTFWSEAPNGLFCIGKTGLHIIPSLIGRRSSNVKVYWI